MYFLARTADGLVCTRRWPTAHHVVLEAIITPGFGHRGVSWCPVDRWGHTVGRRHFTLGGDPPDYEAPHPDDRCWLVSVN